MYDFVDPFSPLAGEAIDLGGLLRFPHAVCSESIFVHFRAFLVAIQLPQRPIYSRNSHAIVVQKPRRKDAKTVQKRGKNNALLTLPV